MKFRSKADTHLSTFLHTKDAEVGMDTKDVRVFHTTQAWTPVTCYRPWDFPLKQQFEQFEGETILTRQSVINHRVDGIGVDDTARRQ